MTGLAGTDAHPPHAHDPNPTPPTADPTLELRLPGGAVHRVTVADLARLPQHTAAGCYIVSTGHGTSGPFDFAGVLLDDLIAAYGTTGWRTADVVSADGFGARIHADELAGQTGDARPVLLAHHRDGAPLTRHQGLVRLIVPDEQEDALRQVKWVARIVVA